jgi:hypothetical protein
MIWGKNLSGDTVELPMAFGDDIVQSFISAARTSAVFRALSCSTNKPVVLKVVPKSQFSSDGAVSQLCCELRPSSPLGIPTS